ncbi:rCG38148, isoform CRA_b [Rattus norvegicus]|uniref:RCG38148, isoform CRA_b n=1 Tax=Rattus norvegicus TaxID=10116 RepID=A6IV24_RAT|nr:rCG38148, isoform CRA_b [Rattus norvegicus]
MHNDETQKHKHLQKEAMTGTQRTTRLSGNNAQASQCPH